MTGVSLIVQNVRSSQCDSMATMSTCAEDGCDRKTQARGLCNTHYSRHRDHGTLPPKKRVTYGRCIADDCDRTDIQSHGLCRKHHQRQRKAAGYKLPPLPECSIDDCPAMQQAKGLCGVHYQTQRRRQITTPCSVSGCDDVGTFAGMCPPHYNRQLRHGSPYGGGPRRYKPPIHICENCGESFQRPNDRRSRRFCSYRCRGQVMRGENNPMWIDGCPSESMRSGSFARAWRLAVLERDEYACQECDITEVLLHVDHIKPWALVPDLRFDLTNGRVLCVPCHMKTPTWGSGSWRSRQPQETAI